MGLIDEVSGFFQFINQMFNLMPNALKMIVVATIGIFIIMGILKIPHGG